MSGYQRPDIGIRGNSSGFEMARLMRELLAACGSSPRSTIVKHKQRGLEMLELCFVTPSISCDLPRKAPLILPEHVGRSHLLKRDQALFLEGDADDSHYLVIGGALRLSRQLPDGRRHVASFYAAGDLIAPESAGSCSFTAEAIVDSVIRRYSRSAIDYLVQSNPQVALQLLSLSYDRLAWAQNQMVVLGRKTADERIATFLLEHAARLPNHKRLMKMPMSRADIADYLGLTAETVSRVLSKLDRCKVVELLDIHSIRVLDEDRLEEISGA